VTFADPVVGISLSFDRSNAGEVYFVAIEGVQVSLETLIANGGSDLITAFAEGSAVGTHEVTAAGKISTAASV